MFNSTSHTNITQQIKIYFDFIDCIYKLAK